MLTHNFNDVNIAYQIYLNALKRFISNLKRKIIRIDRTFLPIKGYFINVWIWL